VPATLTVADLNRRCAQLGLDPATTILLIERDVPTPVTVADQTVTIANGQHAYGLSLDGPDEGDGDWDDEDED
jgi:hypothetical protein